MAARAGRGRRLTGTPACPACGGRLAPWCEVPAFEPSDDRLFPLSRCAACGSAVTGGEPPGPGAYETGIYAPGEPRAAALVARAQRLLLAQPARMLRRAGLPPGAGVLDAGAGRGRLVEVLRAAGYDARGIDPRGGPLVERAAIETHSASGLDAVVLWHVLEHLDDPSAALERVRGWLRPGGLLLVGAPNIESWQARIAGARWFHLDAPRHRTHFSERGLRRALELAGLRVERVHRHVWQHNPLGAWLALLTRLGMTPGFPFHLLKRNVEPRPRDLALLALAGPLLALPALALERAGTVAVLARRGS